MPTLTIFRHAKSSWDEPGLDDFDRPLAPRGRRAVPRMAALLVEAGIAPDLVLSSPAARTRETLALLLETMPKPAEIRFEDELYLAEAAELLVRLRQCDAGRSQVMLVGHNPGLHALAMSLVGEGDPGAMTALARKFPTAAVAVIDFPGIAAWPGLVVGSGRLRFFCTPRSLD